MFMATAAKLKNVNGRLRLSCRGGSVFRHVLTASVQRHCFTSLGLSWYQKRRGETMLYMGLCSWGGFRVRPVRSQLWECSSILCLCACDCALQLFRSSSDR